MSADNKQEESWLTEPKQCDGEQADRFVIVERPIDLNALEWHAEEVKEVVKQIKNNLKNKRVSMKISELIKELEKIKEEHGDLPVKTWEYDEYDGDYYLDEIDYPEYNNYSEDEECVVIGQ